MALDLAVTGMQALRLQGKSRGIYRVKAGSSYVDETLFGNPTRASRVVVTDFDPPWAEKTSAQKPLLWSPQATGERKEMGTPQSSSPASTPRKKYRVKRRSPSFCDETLFGPRLEEPGWEAPWTKKEDLRKLRPLLWSPPSAPRVQSSRPSRAKQCPLKAVHPETPDSLPVDFETEYKGTSDFWTQPDSEPDSPSCSERQGQPRSPARGHRATADEKHGRLTLRSAPDTMTTFHSTPGLTRPRSVSFSGLGSARRATTTGVQASKPPWK